MERRDVGPLAGIKVVEIAGLGPGPYAGMLLADMGAQVLRFERDDGYVVGYTLPPELAVHQRGKHLARGNLKDPATLAAVLDLVAHADILIEGFRPGVVERLGLGPDDCLTANPGLVYGRVTGWGQDGPLSQTAGHDLNYIALTGALAAIGSAGKPAVPLNLIGDYAGGSLFLVIGVLAALAERNRSGAGQVIDAAMIDGAASLMSTFFGQMAGGLFSTKRESNLLDGSAPFYDVYRTKNNRWVSIGAIETKFFTNLIEVLGLDAAFVTAQYDRAVWPEMRAALEQRILELTSDELCAMCEGLDVCMAPVLDMTEAPMHPHNQHRQTFVSPRGIMQPAPAPRFSRTPSDMPGPCDRMVTREFLMEWGIGSGSAKAIVRA
jgi:alpha-methylacyl-CoA racemase